ncbi:MAG: hypothetical protein QM766_01665 [Burkholderiaceae bacterium]
MGLFDILQQVFTASGGLNAEHADRHFDDVVNATPPDVFQQGVAETLRSDQTPPLGDMVSHMFGNASPQGRADILNQILASLGPAVLGGMAGAAGGGILDKLSRGGGAAPAGGMPNTAAPAGGGLEGGLGSILGGLLGAGAGGGALQAPGQVAPSGAAAGGSGGLLPTITPEQASQLSPEEVGQIAAEAEKHNPSIIDSLSEFYARNPALVKTLGGAVLAIAMAKIHERMRNS